MFQKDRLESAEKIRLYLKEYHPELPCITNLTHPVADKIVVACGNSSGRTVDKFSKFSLNPVPAPFVKAPLIDECYANLECRVIDAKLATHYNINFQLNHIDKRFFYP